jgi:iron-sulfur cluster assembly accessory protein
MSVTQEKISPSMTIEDILTKFPGKSQRLAHQITSAGLHCVGCQASTWETLEAGMLGHGMSMERVQQLVDSLNAILEEESDPTAISLTAKAAEKFREFLAEEGKSGWGMRFGEEAGGCGGLNYVLDYSEKADADDAVFSSHDVKIHVKKAILPRLVGAEIDYIDGLHSAGFKISNPNARSSCGCGTSHNY